MFREMLRRNRFWILDKNRLEAQRHTHTVEHGVFAVGDIAGDEEEGGPRGGGAPDPHEAVHLVIMPGPGQVGPAGAEGSPAQTPDSGRAGLHVHARCFY